jgi:hypothetical protein
MSALYYINPTSWIFNASSFQQQSTGIYVAPLENIVLILSQPVFARTL